MILAVALLVAGPAQAQSVFFTYAQWERLPEWPRATYIAGLIDAWVPMSNAVDLLLDAGVPEETPRTSSSIQYGACISRSRMTDAQIAANLRTFVSMRPNLQAGPVLRALVAYLGELCRTPDAASGR
jgi:hypothetical protein